MKLFFYAFAPFGHNHINVSGQVIHELVPHPDLTTHVFPTRFNQNQFIRKLNEIQPTHIIGLGQYPRERRLRIETQATNEYRSKKHPMSSTIIPEYPPTLQTSLMLPVTSSAYKSTNAGRYVCNYSMYIVESWAREHGAKFAFIHIPKTAKNIALTYIRNLIKDIGS